MIIFQEKQSGRGLENIEELEEYCYYVAGVIGEMLTILFTHFSIDTKAKEREMSELAIPFGIALQMTNVMKDLWEDFEQKVCWLPKDIFHQSGFDLNRLAKGQKNKNFEAGIKELVLLNFSYLKKALNYTLLIPKSESGTRKFCYWNLGMAVLTIRKISQNPGFISGEEVKISRNSVQLVAIASSILIKSNLGLRLLFFLLGRGIK